MADCWWLTCVVPRWGSAFVFVVDRKVIEIMKLLIQNKDIDIKR